MQAWHLHNADADIPDAEWLVRKHVNGGSGDDTTLQIL